MGEAVIDLVPSVMHSGRAKESGENDDFSSYHVSILNFKAFRLVYTEGAAEYSDIFSQLAFTIFQLRPRPREPPGAVRIAHSMAREAPNLPLITIRGP